MEFLQTQLLSDRETECNWQSREASSSTNDYCGKNDTLYYQPQPSDIYNQRQQCHNHITTQQAPYRTSHNKEKVDKRVVTHSGIHSPDIKQ